MNHRAEIMRLRRRLRRVERNSHPPVEIRPRVIAALREFAPGLVRHVPITVDRPNKAVEVAAKRPL